MSLILNKYVNEFINYIINTLSLILLINISIIKFYR